MKSINLNPEECARALGYKTEMVDILNWAQEKIQPLLEELKDAREIIKMHAGFASPRSIAYLKKWPESEEK